jgi:hypothetical protein
VANSLLQYLILRSFITMVEMRKKCGLLKDRLNSELCHMSTDCSIFGGSSGNPACANLVDNIGSIWGHVLDLFIEKESMRESRIRDLHHKCLAKNNISNTCI